MTSSAGIGDLVFIGHGGSDKSEGVSADLDVGNSRGDFRHMACDATAAGGAFFVLGVLFDRGGAGAVQRKWAVAIEAQLVGGFAELRVVIGTVCVMAAEAGDAAAVHQALDEVIALHAVLVCRAIRVVREACLPERELFQLPEIPQF